MASLAPSPGDLLELAQKYQTLAVLRKRRDSGARAVPRQTLRALAERYPGCLRELDTLGAAEIERRRGAAAAAAAGASQEPWMAWIWTYHRLMRATLLLKRKMGKRRSLPPAELATLARDAGRVAGLVLGDVFVRAVARPPQHRIGVLVLERIGELFASPPREVAEILFPVRRPSPYTLRE